MNLTPATPLAANPAVATPASPALSPGAQVLAACRAEGRAALVGYLPVGFPSVAGSIEAMVAMVWAGFDIIEVGIPYSDPPAGRSADPTGYGSGARGRLAGR